MLRSWHYRLRILLGCRRTVGCASRVARCTTVKERTISTSPYALAVCWAASARLTYRAQWLEPKAATGHIDPCASWLPPRSTTCLVASYPTIQHARTPSMRTHMRAGIMSTANSAVAPQPILGSIRTHRRLWNLFVFLAFLEFSCMSLCSSGTNPQAYLTTRTQKTS